VNVKNIALIFANVLLGIGGYFVFMYVSFDIWGFLSTPSQEEANLGWMILIGYTATQIWINYKLMTFEKVKIMYAIIITILSNVFMFVLIQFFMEKTNDFEIDRIHQQEKNKYLKKHPVFSKIVKEKSSLPKPFTFNGGVFNYGGYFDEHFTMISFDTNSVEEIDSSAIIKNKQVKTKEVKKLIDWLFERGKDNYYIALNDYDNDYPIANIDDRNYILTVNKKKQILGCVPSQSDVCKSLTYQYKDIAPFIGTYSSYAEERSADSAYFDYKKSYLKENTFYLYFDVKNLEGNPDDNDEQIPFYTILDAVEQDPNLARMNYHIELTEPDGKQIILDGKLDIETDKNIDSFKPMVISTCQIDYYLCKKAD